jgi:hypothetical protein
MRKGTTMSETKIPFSLRLSIEEHKTLKEAAGQQSMAQYARVRLFGDGVKLRKKRGLKPIEDREALGRVLGKLGASNVSQNLAILAEAAQSGCLQIDAKTLMEISQACAEIKALRSDLMQALGLKIKKPSVALSHSFLEAAE